MRAILDHPLVASRIFYPRPSHLAPTHTMDVDGVTLTCYFAQPDADAPTILYFHGDGELASDHYEAHAPLFVEKGINICYAEYRGYGMTGGSPAPVEQLGDGLRFVRGLKLDPAKLIAFGRSLGSVYALELANQLPGLAGLVLESGIAYVGEDWPLDEALRKIGKSRAELDKEIEQYFDHQKKLACYRGPLLVLHTINDVHVSKSHAERLYKWSSSKEKKLVLFPKGDHNSIFAENADEYLQELVEFL